MHVVLLRHGIAEDRTDLPDEDRALTEKGADRTVEACLGLVAMDVEPELILTSPLRRAFETAAIASELLDCPSVRETDALRGGAHPGLIFGELAHLDVGTVLCVGHAPHLDLVLAQAIASGQASIESIKKAGAACIEFSRVAAGLGHLVWQLQPRALRALGGGD
ncbi:MAG: histidine phosphatase family protein [Planctomycetota bacterium]|nr:histidine phosphatase family protein [Planctomycetota bacterium]